MHAPSSHMNGGSHHEFSLWDPPFMWEEGARIYGTPGVHNNFPPQIIFSMSKVSQPIPLQDIDSHYTYESYKVLSLTSKPQ